MKKCPFCAEEIQDAAVVCRYCGREIAMSSAPAAAVRTKASPRWGRILLVTSVVLAIPVVLLYCGADHQRYLAFSAQRDAWHRRCDLYIDKPTITPAARACAEELTAMVAYAKRQGWD